MKKLKSIYKKSVNELKEVIANNALIVAQLVVAVVVFVLPVTIIYVVAS